MSISGLALVGYAVLGFAGLAAFLITLWRTQWSGIYQSTVAFLLAALAAYFALVLLSNPPAAEVHIQKLTRSTSASSLWFVAEGNVLPGDAKVQLLVHPSSTGSAQPWWVQPPMTQVGGEWTGQICLGTGISGKGQYFQIIALASPRPTWIDALHYQELREGQQLDQIPALPRSEIVTIWRNE